MASLLTCSLVSIALWPVAALCQSPAPSGSTPATPAPAAPQPLPSRGPVFDPRTGWPDVPEEPERRSVVPDRIGRTIETKPPASNGDGQAPAAPMAEASAPRAVTPPVASGMDLGSPLLEVFEFTRPPGAFQALGGRRVWWRVTVYGSQGEILGIRELTQIAECSAAERDRLEYETEGRTYGRLDGAAFAQRQGMPWPSDAERGRDELQLFGTHLRLPWCFGDGQTYSVMSSGTVERPGERLRTVAIERRPRPGSELIGPEIDPRPRDRFELIFESGTGKPRELVHRFASSGLARRVLFEDWRDDHGIRMPYRRVYVDEALQRTTMLEILNLDPQPVTERTFRLH